MPTLTRLALFARLTLLLSGAIFVALPTAAQSPPAPSASASAAAAASASASASAPVATATPVEPWQRWFLATSVYTRHFHYDPAHNDDQRMVALEWRHDERYGIGLTLFDNSFDQPSQYLFASARFRPLDSFPGLYIRVTGGIVHGYKGEYRNKIPLNSSGFAPAIVPMLGYCRWHLCSELVLFGTNGATLLVGARF